MTRFFNQWIFFFPDGTGTFHHDNATTDQAQTLKEPSLMFREHEIPFSHIYGNHRVQTLTTLRIFGMCWKRLHTAARLSHHQYRSWRKINMTLDGNKWCNNAMGMCAVRPCMYRGISIELRVCHYRL